VSWNADKEQAVFTIETSHNKRVISDILPRHTYAAGLSAIHRATTVHFDLHKNPSHHRDGCAQLKAANSELETLASRAAREAKRLEIVEGQLKREDKELRRQAESKDKQIADLNHTIKCLRLGEYQKFKTIKDELKTTEGKLTTTEGELKTTKDELATTKDKLATTKDKLATTKDKLATTKDKLATTEGELATTEDKLAGVLRVYGCS
jgi:chromosome segregation ATPase